MCNIKKILPKFCYIPYWNTKCSLLQQRETQVDCQKVLQTLNLSGTYQGEHGILSTIYTNLDNRLCVIALTKLCLSSLIIYLQYSLPQNPQHIFFYFCSFNKSFFFQVKTSQFVGLKWRRSELHSFLQFFCCFKSCKQY